MSAAGKQTAETISNLPNAIPGLADHAKLDVAFVLPNLELTSPVETNYVGILPSSDPRVIQIAKRSPATHALINNFTNHRGGQITVSVMVVHKDAPKSVKDVAALVSFRNIYAVACVLQSWQFSIGSPNAWGTRFSDYYDFYPYAPTPDGEHLFHIGHAFSIWDTPDNFRGQPYPEFSRNQLALHTKYDEQLFSLLLKAWTTRFERDRKSWKSNKLFRSLAIAYHACSLPKKNGLWFYDFGVSIALWISAFEILAHPGRSSKSDLSAVLNLLSKARFRDAAVRRQRKIKNPKNPNQTGNAAEFLYWRSYKSRNAFLHGNPVTDHDVLYKNRSRHSLLTSVAPILFTVALLCHFDRFATPPTRKIVRRRIRALDWNMERYFTKSRLEKALKHILTGKDRTLI